MIELELMMQSMAIGFGATFGIISAIGIFLYILIKVDELINYIRLKKMEKKIECRI